MTGLGRRCLAVRNARRGGVSAGAGSQACAVERRCPPEVRGTVHAEEEEKCPPEGREAETREDKRPVADWRLGFRRRRGRVHEMPAVSGSSLEMWPIAWKEAVSDGAGRRVSTCGERRSVGHRRRGIFRRRGGRPNMHGRVDRWATEGEEGSVGEAIAPPEEAEARTTEIGDAGGRFVRWIGGFLPEKKPSMRKEERSVVDRRLGSVEGTPPEASQKDSRGRNGGPVVYFGGKETMEVSGMGFQGEKQREEERLDVKKIT